MTIGTIVALVVGALVVGLAVGALVMWRYSAGIRAAREAFKGVKL